MKIIFGATSFDHDRHARQLLKAKAEKARKSGGEEPVGIVSTLALFMHRCDDCGGTYWDSDEWGGSHIGCRGVPKKVGF